MSRWLPDRRRRRTVHALGLDAQRLTWHRPGAAAGDLPADGRHADIAIAVEGVARGSVVDIIVAADVAVHWVQAPPAAVASLEELRQVALARCAHLHGKALDDWWVTGDWAAGRRFVCAGLPRAVTVPMERRLQDAALSVRWHTSWGLACTQLHRSVPVNGWTALRSPCRVVMWQCRDGQADRMQVFAVDPRASDLEAATLALAQHDMESRRADDVLPGPLYWLSVSPHGEPPADVRVKVISSGWRRDTTAHVTEAGAALALARLLTGGAT